MWDGADRCAARLGPDGVARSLIGFVRRRGDCPAHTVFRLAVDARSAPTWQYAHKCARKCVLDRGVHQDRFRNRNTCSGAALVSWSALGRSGAWPRRHPASEFLGLIGKTLTWQLKQ